MSCSLGGACAPNSVPRIPMRIAFTGLLLGLGLVESAAAAAKLAMYNGYNSTAATDEISRWLGREVEWGLAYLDHTKEWENVAYPGYTADSWAEWIKAAPGRNLIVSVPLLISKAEGRMQECADGGFNVHFASLARQLAAKGLGKVRTWKAHKCRLIAHSHGGWVNVRRVDS